MLRCSGMVRAENRSKAAGLVSNLVNSGSKARFGHRGRFRAGPARPAVARQGRGFEYASSVVATPTEWKL